ncbi:galactokinase [Sphingobacterium tabacisoli]|uniref:Galactokinase n=1 Tax=Sphingobacterium tabacisoli TaxID=2044855 RepID=A0ABW5L954_9SPHI|nr:galactokinase [Sphingobacterium tabacisoli]
MDNIANKVATIHTQRFDQEPDVFRSPGRINIIGEHTDYNEGFVLPAAIDRYVYIGISRRVDNLIKLYSINFDKIVYSTVELIEMQEEQWANYILGICKLLAPTYSHGFEMTVYGDVPIGAGLSSSAALESAVGYAVNAVFALGYDRMQLAQIGQQCEHQFIGVRCGIMDQFASLHGRLNQVMKLDCRNLDYSYFPLELGDYEFVLLNTNVSHSLASSAYNDRRSQCETGVAQLQMRYPEVHSLRDASVEMLDLAIPDPSEQSYIKSRFVIEEIQRVSKVCDYLNEGALDKVGELMYATHRGLKEAYEVSCPELDYLVDYIREYPEVLGARMMGGGFGGCTLNLVKKTFVAELIERVSKAYESLFGIALDSYVVKLGEGTAHVH